VFVSETCDFPLLDDATAIERVRSAVAAERPFSLIRLGDGEAVVLSYGNDMWLQDVAYLHGHWGAERVPLGAIEEVRRDLEAAIDGADIIGVRDDIIGVRAPDDLLQLSGPELRRVVCSDFPIRPDEIENLSNIGARRVALLHRALGRRAWSEHQEFCSAWIHWELLASGALAEILDGVTEVGLVTAKPELEHLVARRFDVRTSVVLVPDKQVESPQPGTHVPDRYRTVRADLTFPPGTLVLVGAGIPGKAYCQWLKEAGCIAVDVGAVFDAWLGKASRPRVLESRFGVGGGRSVPRELQLRPSVSRDDRVLVPRWKSTGAPR
jgi:hypothetical protein